MRYGLIGEKLGHSFSAEIHKKIGRYEYQLMEIAPEELESFMLSREFDGINVTIPYKQAVIPYLDDISESAKQIGAVNTIVNRSGKLTGYNTDCTGLEMLIRKAGIDIKGKKVLIAGSGGTSRTAAAAAENLGASAVFRMSRRKDTSRDEDRIDINRRLDANQSKDSCLANTEHIPDISCRLVSSRVEIHTDMSRRKDTDLVNTERSTAALSAAPLAAEPGTIISYEDAYKNHSDAQILINTTPVGMYPDVDGMPVDLDRFPELEGVIDVVYNPLTTRLAEAAHEKGIKAENGLYMLVSQAVAASELFSGSIADGPVDQPDPAAQSRRETPTQPDPPTQSRKETPTQPDPPTQSRKETPTQPDPPAGSYEADILGMIDQIYSELLAEKSNIVLVGMPGSGKSTVSRVLADQLERELISTDEEIVRREGMPITETFRLHGEKYFRDAESEIIKELSQTGGKIIDTGGGAVLRQENLKNLRMNGIIVFLDRPPEDIQPDGTRPLADSKAKIRALYEERLPIYKQAADITIPVNGSIEETTRHILTDIHFISRVSQQNILAQ